MCVCYRLVVIPTTMKLCVRAMPTITINIHEFQVCKQQQIASGTKSSKFILMLIILFKLGTLVYTPYHSHDKTTITSL